jgi:predicted  nucleic acid-binding Zn-ribbon protein
MAEETSVARMRLEQQMHDIQRNVLGCKIRLIEIEDEKKRLHTNIDSSDKAMADLQQQIEELDHPVSPDDAKGDVNG